MQVCIGFAPMTKHHHTLIADVANERVQMVTVEVELKEGDEEPEQHLDDGEHIERVVVPISELYEKLQGE